MPLEHWPTENIAALPKGLSRHTVRFAHLNDHVIAIKETLPELARREYDMLKKLQSLDVPCVEPFAIINNRTTAEGEELLSVLITRHLKFSLPYRAMWSQGLRPETATRLVDALAVLLVRLHIAGFFWGDVSLSNTLFRRDAGAFAAYLVDAETGRLSAEVQDTLRRINAYRAAGATCGSQRFEPAPQHEQDRLQSPTPRARSAANCRPAPRPSRRWPTSSPSTR